MVYLNAKKEEEEKCDEYLKHAESLSCFGCWIDALSFGLFKCKKQQSLLHQWKESSKKRFQALILEEIR